MNASDVPAFTFAICYSDEKGGFVQVVVEDNGPIDDEKVRELCEYEGTFRYCRVTDIYRNHSRLESLVAEHIESLRQEWAHLEQNERDAKITRLGEILTTVGSLQGLPVG